MSFFLFDQVTDFEDVNVYDREGGGIRELWLDVLFECKCLFSSVLFRSISSVLFV